MLVPVVSVQPVEHHLIKWTVAIHHLRHHRLVVAVRILIFIVAIQAVYHPENSAFGFSILIEFDL